jgi:AbrB family looped-hinge helix DNA binding protein
MTYTISITSQGQLSIPAKIRRDLGFSATNNKALLTIEGNKIILEPVVDLLDLAGSLQTSKKPLTNSQLHNMYSEATAI